MNECALSAFLQKNEFLPCAEYSIPETGMSSKVNAFVVGNIRLRIVTDRGQQFIDLACSGTDVWTDVFTLALQVDGSFQVKRGSFSEAIQALIHYWPKFVAKLSERQNKKE